MRADALPFLGRRAILLVEEPTLEGEHDRLGAVTDLELLQDPRDVGLTVVSLMKSSCPISALDMPLARRQKTSISFGVSVRTAAGGGRRCKPVKCRMTFFVTDGESRASPAAIVRTAAMSCSGGSSLSTKPLAPALSAS